MKNIIKNNIDFTASFFHDIETNPYLPVFWIDAEGYIFNVNDAVCAYLGYSREELLKMNICEIDPYTTRAMVSELVNIIRHSKINKFESCHKRKDGVILDVEIVSNFYCIEGIEFSFNYVFDNTEKKLKERELIESNKKLEKLTNHQENLIENKTKQLCRQIAELEKSEERARLNEELFINAFKTSQDSINLNSIEDGTYIMVNDGFTKIMGYTQEEVLGKSSLELNIWKDPNDRLRLVNAIKKNGYCHNLRADFRKKDGGIIHGLMSASIHEYNGKKVILNVSKDITKLKQLENKLIELNTNLQKKVEEEVALIRRQQEIIFEQKKLADMGMMINAIAHQWRQPLNIIGLRTQEVADYYREGLLTDKYIDDFEENQMDTVEHLSSTIEDFRTFFKPDDKESVFDVCSVIIKLVKLIEIQMLAKGIKTYLSYKSGSTAFNRVNIGDFPQQICNDNVVKGFKGEFKQVVTNLVYNSIFAIEEQFKNNKQTDGFVHIGIVKTDDNIKIIIEDNGGGICESIMPHIFNPYFTTKKDSKGTGLGLYLAKLIIETHMNGIITVENTSCGTQFIISLPSVQP